MRGPWYRQVTREQWRAFWAVFLGWVVDSFDFNILTFILIDIMNDFSVDRALAGALGTVTLVMRLIGGSIAGTAADKWGRKLPLMISVLWFSLFAFLSGFSTSYAMLFAFRALFGLGMGGEWAAGMPLVFEHWPTRLRGLVSGLMLGGWYWGYLLAAATFQFVYPWLIANSEDPAIAWRAMFWIAIVPALFTLWIRARVSESPVWLEQQRRRREAPRARRCRPGAGDLDRAAVSTWTAGDDDPDDDRDRRVHVHLLLGDLLVSHVHPRSGTADAAVSRGAQRRRDRRHRDMGTAVGNGPRPARRGDHHHHSGTRVAAVLSVREQTSTSILGAFMMGFFGMGVWGMAPAYTVERFPAAVRGAGPGFCYHAGAAIGALMPWLLGKVQDRGVDLVTGMTVSMVISGLFALAAIWSGPETRGRQFTAE